MTEKRILKWIYTKTKKQTVPMIVLVLSNAVYSLLAVIFALISKGLIDSAVANDIDSAYSYAIAFAIFILIQLILHVVCRALEESIKAKIEISLKHSLFENVLKKDYMAVSSVHSGDILNRMFSDIQIIGEGLTTVIPSAVSLVTRLIAALAVLMVFDTRFALVLILAGVLIFLMTAVFRSKMKLLHKNVQESDGRVRSFMQESIANILPVKVFVKEDKAVADSDRLQKKNYVSRMKRVWVNILANAGFLTVFRAGYLYAVCYGAYGIITGMVTYGTLMAMVQLIGQVQIPFANLSGIIPKYYAVVASAERVAEIEDMPDDISVPKSAKELSDIYKNAKSIRIDCVTFAYEDETVLESASAEIKKGEFVAVTGRSGIGKSTLLKLLLGVYPHYEGKITISSENESYPCDGSMRKLFAYVPQGNMLFSGTIRENITFACDNASYGDIKRALEISCAKEFTDELAQGIDTVIGEHGIGLSEGQLQRLAIARALLTGANVLLFDEATSALDEATEEKLLKNLKSMGNVTCIIVSHKKAAVDICDKAIELCDKKISVV